VSRMRPVDHVETAAEAVRALNHATLGVGRPEGYEWPADVDAVVAALTVLAQRLPQALTQAAGWLERASAARAIGHDAGGNPVAEAGTAVVLLRFAAARADTLARDLGGVRQVTCHLTGRAPTSIPSCRDGEES
jgi:hypothetical protein